MTRLYLGTQGWSYPSWVGPVLSAGHASSTLPGVLRDPVQHGRARHHLLRHPTRQHGRRLARAHAGRLPLRGQVPPSDHAREGAAATAARDERLRGRDGRAGRQARRAAAPDAAAVGRGGHGAISRSSCRPCRPATGMRSRCGTSHGWRRRRSPTLTELLQAHGVALCLVQHAWMPALETVTAPFVYIRWLGRREDIPDDDFSHVRINRDVQLDRWAAQVQRVPADGRRSSTATSTTTTRAIRRRRCARSN